jgi:hypothetical protein
MTSFNPLAPVTDYQSMLNRIFWFTTGSALVAIWMLRRYNPALNELLGQIDFQFEFGSNKIFPIPGGYLFPALAVGILTRIYHLHARISDVFGIREAFDIGVILREFATRLNLDVTPLSYELLVEHRHSVMKTAFYSFVSGSRPSVDQQLVHQALDAWSWFWVGVEATVVFIVTGFALVACGVYDVGLETIGGTIIAAGIGLPAMRAQCCRYAIAQVRAIVADPTRAAAVRTAFAGLTAGHCTRRLAA